MAEGDPNVPATGLEGLSPDVKADPNIANFANAEDLAKSYIETKKMVGASIRIPADGAKPEEWDAALYSKIGWPEKPEAYSKLDKTALPNGVFYNDDFENYWYKMAHDNRLTGKQANAMLQSVNARQLEQFAANDAVGKKEKEACEQKLQGVYGEKLQEVLEHAERFMSQFGSDELKEKIVSSGLGRNPDFVKFLSKLAGQWTEDHNIAGARGITPFQHNREALKAKVAEMKKDPRWEKGDMAYRDEVMAVFEQMPREEKAAAV